MKYLIGIIAIFISYSSNANTECELFVKKWVDDVEKKIQYNIDGNEESDFREFLGNFYLNYGTAAELLSTMMSAEEHKKSEIKKILKVYGLFLMNSTVNSLDYDGFKFLIKNGVDPFSATKLIDSPIIIVGTSRDNVFLEILTNEFDSTSQSSSLVDLKVFMENCKGNIKIQ